MDAPAMDPAEVWVPGTRLAFLLSVCMMLFTRSKANPLVDRQPCFPPV
jgi:hypothetical protein